MQRWLIHSEKFLRFPNFGRAPHLLNHGHAESSYQLRFTKTAHWTVRFRRSDFPARPPLALFGTLPVHLAPERPSVLLVLSIITGLPLALWAYKCLMLVAFQRKIIYMGYAPIGARKEEIARDVPGAYLEDISCEEVQVEGEGNMKLAGILVRRGMGMQEKAPQTVMVYMQGNAGNPLHRLPVFQRLLRSSSPAISGPSGGLAVLAVAPRSYWKSSFRSPTERGILTDYLHVLQYALDRYPSSRILVYGHSLGGAVAVCLLSQLRETEGGVTRDARYCDPRYQNIKGLILENPFDSIPGMVRALYPQRWIPYRYLAPLAFDKWDAVGAMRRSTGKSTSPDGPGGDMGSSKWVSTTMTRLAPETMVLLSEKDEVVPPAMGSGLYWLSRAGVGPGTGRGRKVVVGDALHENAWERRQWLVEMRRYIEEMG